MKQYIDKAAVVAEIKKRFDEYSSSILKHYDACKEAKAQELGKILTILDTLEVKEEILDKDSKTELMKKCVHKAYKRGYDMGVLQTTNKINHNIKDPYEQCVRYDSIEAGIQAHAETYSFNIESQLFHQLTEEQQKLWRKEIEQACISGGNAGVELARDKRYKENLEVV